ncbi:hypothetical protein [Lichenicoccus sp.]|uniref:hypothetical protein n=1 Tax=Lichenicoccus sp. TaxID=2781899 RepID=UPI003D13DDCA
MSDIQRLFVSAAMNPANATVGASPATGPGTAAYGPSGVPGGTIAAALTPGVVGTVQLPTVQAGGGILVRNDGIAGAILFYSDAEPSGDAVWPAAARNASLAGSQSGGTVRIPPGQFVILTDTTAGPIATYTGGPLAIFAGTFQYAVLASPPDHPKAVTKL